MLDAAQMILDEKPVEEPKEKFKFSFEWLASRIIDRQRQGKDTIIVVVGDRRNGKTNWVLKLLRAYIKLRKKENPDFKWSWKDNFPLTRAEASSKADAVEDRSFICYDEGADVMYRADTLSTLNKNLIKFMNKSGKKTLLTMIVLPDIYQLDPKILNMAHFMVAVPYRYARICAFAFIYGRNPNPFITDKFGLERLKRLFNSKKMGLAALTTGMDGRKKVMSEKKWIEIPFPRQLFKFLMSIPTFMYMHRFTQVEQNFEKAYIKNVKDKQLMAHESQDSYINMEQYKKLRKKYMILLLNLSKEGYSARQIAILHRFNDEFWASEETIRFELSKMTALEKGGVTNGGNGSDRELAGEDL
jgi:hypothetical protein